MDGRTDRVDERASFFNGPMPPRGFPGKPPAAAFVREGRGPPATGTTAGRIAGWLAATLSTEWDRGTAFLFVPVVTAAGSVAYFVAGHEPSAGELAVLTGVFACLAWLTRRNLPVHLALAALFLFSVGLGAASLETWRAGTKMLGSEISTRLTGRIVLTERMASGRVRLTLDVISTQRPTLRHVPDRVRLTFRDNGELLRAGDVVSGLARLVPPSGPSRPGGYNFAFDNYFDRIGAKGFYLRAPTKVEEPRPAALASRISAWVENLRSALADRVRSGVEGEAEREIAAALIAGVRAGIPDEANEALRRTGLAHILSISGLHMALVAATIMATLRAAFALFPGFSSRRPVKKYSAAIALVALSVYLFISGSAVAADRSFIMIAVMLVAVLFDRHALTMRNLALAAMLLVLVAPHEVVGPSFQMSFAATAALIGGYRAWSQRSRRRGEAEPGSATVLGSAAALAARYVLGLIMTSMIAGTATAAFGAYHFQRVSALGLVANLAAMPIVSAVVMPFALIGVLLLPLGLDGWAFAVMGEGLSILLLVAGWFSDLSPIDSVGTIPPLAIALLALALVMATLLTTSLKAAALPLLAAALAVMTMRSFPDVLVSEDGRLVAVRSGDLLALNRLRPNTFTLADWLRAMHASGTIKPRKAAAEAGGTAGPAFLCASGLCRAETAHGRLVVFAETAEAAAPLCGQAALVIVNSASAERVCQGGAAAVLTRRDLALRGSASVTFSGQAGGGPADIVFAIDEPYRPWHLHRAFSRAARGLPEFERAKDSGKGR